MPNRLHDGSEGGIGPEEGENALQQALLRLTSPQARELQYDLDCLREEITSLKKLEGDDTTELRKKLVETNLIIDRIERKFLTLGDELRDPGMIEQRLERTVVPALHKQVTERGDDVAQVLAPVIGPAIRRQIRDAKEDIIDALYPLIGQIIGKAISEALRELTRNIDTRLRKQLNFRERISQMLARLRGVSEAELLMRDALPYSFERVFLVHRETGLLLSHISAEIENRTNMDRISGMLTAIQDFVRDSFSGGEGNLEEITHGGRRILLESGQHAYLAVVLSGVEPVGYNDRIREVNAEINLRYERDLKSFDGDMGRLPDFKPLLSQLLSPQAAPAIQAEAGKPLSPSQKRVVGISLLSFLLLMALFIFACLFVVRLWPVAFAPALAIAPTVLPAHTPTLRPTLTSTALPTSTTLPTSASTPTPLPTNTQAPQPSLTPTALIGKLTGNLYIRAEPSADSQALGTITAGEEVTVIDQHDHWFHVIWPARGEPLLKGWINGEKFLVSPVAHAP